jgi:hypothetical protein
LRRFYYRFFDRLRFARMHCERLRSAMGASSEARCSCRRLWRQNFASSAAEDSGSYDVSRRDPSTDARDDEQVNQAGR